MNVETITYTAGLAIMMERGYDRGQIEEPWSRWIARGDVALIFENADMSHADLGQVFTMPWNAAEPMPTHGPDSSLGLGWRYLTRYRVEEVAS